MKKNQIVGICYVILTLGTLFLMFSNKFALNNVLMFIATIILSANFFFRIYKSEK